MGSRNPERDRLILSDRYLIYNWWLDYPDWIALAVCKGCSSSITLRVKDFIRGKNPPHTVRDLKDRLACEKCGCRMFNLNPRYEGKTR
jgi:hypothetical protein